MSEQQYKYLTDEDTIQAGDEFWAGSAWIEYHEDHIGKFVLVDPSRRPIANAIDQPQRERIAYEELQAGDLIQPGDEHRNADGRWHAYHLSLCGSRVHGAWDGRARRPYKISTILEIGDALADAQKAATQLQNERDNALAALKSAQRARDELQLQVDELRAERERLQGLIDNLLDEPTARQVRDMLRTWATELDWSECCFDVATRDKVSAVQRVLGSVIERVEWLCSENSDDN